MFKKTTLFLSLLTISHVFYPSDSLQEKISIASEKYKELADKQNRIFIEMLQMQKNFTDSHEGYTDSNDKLRFSPKQEERIRSLLPEDIVPEEVARYGNVLKNEFEWGRSQSNAIINSDPAVLEMVNENLNIYARMIKALEENLSAAKECLASKSTMSEILSL